MSDLANTIKQICEEKGLSVEAVVGTIESALAAAYRKDFGQKNQNIKVKFNIESGNSEVFDIKTVVEDMSVLDEENAEGEKETEKKSEVQKPLIEKEKAAGKEAPEGEEERKFNPKTEIQISEAKKIKKSVKLGDEIKTELEIPAAYGRMAAQTAKQVIIQRLREAEREMIYNDFKEKEREVISGVVQRREGRIVLIDLGKTVGVLPSEEQIYNEYYKPGARIKVYVKGVNIGSKGPEVILSRISDEILKKIFYLEIPEISNGLVELRSVAREAGSRSKVAVAAISDNIDPIGSCVGQRGARIQTIISELGGEKVDIIEYDDNPEKFIANSLSPAKIINIETDEKERKATVKVADDQLSLAIGKGGQNVRLAARLTGWKIDIVGKKSEETEKNIENKEDKGESSPAEVMKSEEKKEDEKKEKKEKKTKKGKKEKNTRLSSLEAKTISEQEKIKEDE